MPPLARKTYAARRSQLISTFGVGSLFPAENNSFMVTSIDQWDKQYLKKVSEPRLARSLRVSELLLPPAGTRGRIPVVRFPQMLVCPNCNRIGTISQLQASYEDPKCGLCKSLAPLTPSRFVVACEDGHIDDFPYAYWVHGHSPIDKDAHKLTLTSEGRTSSLADLVVRCSCGITPRTMADAFNSIALKEMKCQGNRPWLGWGYREKDCGQASKTVQRGASNVWFAAIRSAISIPPYSEFLAKVVAHEAAQLSRPEALAAESKWVLEGIVEKFDGNFSVDELKAEIRRQFHGDDTSELSESQLREQEFLALMTGRQDSPDTDFVAEKVEVPSAYAHWIKAARKVTRLREVRALQGFSRLIPRTADHPETKLSPLYPEDNQQNWLPAIETLGEGLFIALDRAQVEEWAATDFAVGRQRTLLNNAQKAAEMRRQDPVPVNIVETLVHTLSHIIIDQLSLEAGYPASSIRERLYVGQDQVGVLLYTASSDSAGSLGGIAAQASPELLGASLQEGLFRTSWCSADPVCIESRGSGTDARNLAACHCCVLVPETSCELFNSNLDRGSLFGVHGQIGLGFLDWSKLAPLRRSEGGAHTGVDGEESGIPEAIRQSEWRTVYVESNESVRDLIVELVEVGVDLASWGADIGTDNEWQLDLSWPSTRVAILEDRDENRDDWLANEGWTVYHLEDFAPADLADKLLESIE